MEAWFPLFDIFMKSLSPETEASLWLQQSFNPSSSISITTTSFLSLLTKPTTVVIVDSSTPSSSSAQCPQSKRIMWIQTLPNVVQSRILSFLAFEHRKFCASDLSNVARNLLSDDQELDFWVKRAAHQLLDLVSDSSYEWVSGLSLDSEGEKVDEEFGEMPYWLKQAAKDCDRVFPWVPMLSDELNWRMPLQASGNFDVLPDDVKSIEEEDMNKVGVGVDFVPRNNDPVTPETEKMAVILKSQMLNSEFTLKAVELADEIQKLCDGRGGNSLAVLSLIEPWQAEDETASVILSHLTDGSNDELGWPSHVLCSIALPKLLVLEEPASRVLVTAIIEHCKLHQISAVYALLYPLILRKEGINNSIGDVIARVVRECLHPAHVSSFCQKLLCGEEGARKLICLPCHQHLISDELVWNESLFSLFQIILNHNVHLTEDSVAQLVYHVGESAERFRNSLKFGNFLLCLIGKCTPSLRTHKLSLIRAAENTNTLVTKSLISKLTSL